MLQLHLLGSPQIYLHGELITGLPAIKSQAVLYYLAMQGRPQSRLALAGMLWGTKNDSQALMNLRQALHQLRLALPGCLLATRTNLAINPSMPIEIDALRFAQQASTGLAGNQVALYAAGETYNGEFLTGFYLDEASGFEEWLFQEREWLHSLAFRSLRALLDLAVQRREIGLGLRYARHLLALEPWLEEAHRHLMQLLAWDNQVGAALVQYERCRQILANELGVAPSPQTIALYKWIRTGANVDASLHPTLSLTLSPQVTSFVGREQELENLTRLLCPPIPGSFVPRLITIIGPGGVGKTRLALELVATLHERFPHATAIVQLEALADPTRLPVMVAAALGLGDHAHTLLSNLQRSKRRMLLVLDNCDHLLAACANVTDTLLRAYPHLHILATSRAALRVDGEVRFPLHPLATPDLALQPTHLAENPAARLFIQRVSLFQPALQLSPEIAAAIAHICNQLDGLPLAIELAAAHAACIPITQIATDINDGFLLQGEPSATIPPRHQSLSALVDWSSDLLSPAERELFYRLAVFVGGWSIAACEAICADAETSTGSLALSQRLISLVDTSLVILDEQQGLARYRMLETIRQYASTRLQAAGDTAPLRTRHMRFFSTLAETCAAQIYGPDHAEWLVRITSEDDNLRTALGWALDTDPATALRLAAAMQAIEIALAPPTAIESTTALTPSALPVPRTSFIARPSEVAAISDLLRTTRLLVLSGPPGVGKTRLALHTASQHGAHFSHGVCFVDLAPLSDPTQVALAIADALGLCWADDQPALAAIQTYLANQHMLLLLDTCEHLVAACEHVLAALLASAPALSIIATSRERLAIAGARHYLVPPLALPDLAQDHDPATISRYAAIQLFSQRAAAAQPNFVLSPAHLPASIHICQQLDGLPLAIELAAARLSALSISQIAAQLSERLDLLGGNRSAHPRHQSLYSAIAWSYALLSAPERAMLHHMAVSASASTPQQIAATSNLPVTLLDALVNKSLVCHAEATGRYWLLKSIRIYLHAQGDAREVGSEG